MHINQIQYLNEDLLKERFIIRIGVALKINFGNLHVRPRKRYGYDKPMKK